MRRAQQFNTPTEAPRPLHTCLSLPRTRSPLNPTPYLPPTVGMEDASAAAAAAAAVAAAAEEAEAAKAAAAEAAKGKGAAAAAPPSRRVTRASKRRQGGTGGSPGDDAEAVAMEEAAGFWQCRWVGGWAWGGVGYCAGVKEAGPSAWLSGVVCVSSSHLASVPQEALHLLCSPIQSIPRT